jgi:predicted DNA binding CopG/RHH family protein
VERKPLARVQSREVRVTFRLTEQEASALRDEAAARDVEVSRLIRRWLLMGQRMDALAMHEKAALA